MHKATRCSAGARMISVVSLLLTACGGAAKELEAPAAPSSAPAYKASPGYGQEGADARPASLPDALAQLAQAEAEIRQALGVPTFASPPGDRAQPAPPSAAPSATTAPAPRASEAAGDQGAQSLSVDPCVTACRALASMSRSAEHVCGLAGEADERCASARFRVSGAEGRVRSQCPACR